MKEKPQRKNDNLHICICNNPQVVNAPFTNDNININNDITGEVIKTKVTD